VLFQQAERGKCIEQHPRSAQAGIAGFGDFLSRFFPVRKAGENIELHRSRQHAGRRHRPEHLHQSLGSERVTGRFGHGLLLLFGVFDVFTT